MLKPRVGGLENSQRPRSLNPTFFPNELWLTDGYKDFLSSKLLLPISLQDTQGGRAPPVPEMKTQPLPAASPDRERDLKDNRG